MDFYIHFLTLRIPFFWDVTAGLRRRNPLLHRIENVNTDRLTNSTEQIPSWEPNSSSSSHEITRILWNPKVHYRIH
jgi:hypothetical protein